MQHWRHAPWQGRPSGITPQPHVDVEDAQAWFGQWLAGSPPKPEPRLRVARMLLPPSCMRRAGKVARLPSPVTAWGRASWWVSHDRYDLAQQLQLRATYPGETRETVYFVCTNCLLCLYKNISQNITIYHYISEFYRNVSLHIKCVSRTFITPKSHLRYDMIRRSRYAGT